MYPNLLSDVIRGQKVATIPAQWTEMKPRLENVRLVDTNPRIWRHQRESWKQNNRKKFPIKKYFCENKSKSSSLRQLRSLTNFSQSNRFVLFISIRNFNNGFLMLSFLSFLLCIIFAGKKLS